MGITTNLNIAPYYDDYNDNKNFHRVMFRPSVPVQARELTQLQTILQNQIERFGENIYKEGTIIKGCSFSYDEQYDYVKLLDNRVDAQPLNVLQHDGQWVRGANNNIIANVVAVDAGLQTDGINLNTFFIKYVNSAGPIAGFIQSEVLSIYPTRTDAENQTNAIAQIAIADAATYGSLVTGTGFAFEITEGIIFQKGHFVRVNPQKIVVSKYSAQPDQVAVGFETIESLVDENADTSLLDNAAGYSNVNAPGSHRLKLEPKLVTLTFAEMTIKDNFFALAEFEEGKVVKSRQLTEFSSLAREMARRTAEESGDYVVEPFRMITEPHPSDANKFNLITSAGVGYVNGYRIENTNNNITVVDKGITTKTINNQALSVAYGSFVIVKEMIGSFDYTSGVVLSLRDVTGQRITDKNFATPTAVGNEIGSARIVSVERISGIAGTPGSRHRIYINDIKMAVGKNFKDVKSVWFDSGVNGMADLVLEGSPPAAIIKDTAKNSLIFPFANTAVKDITNSSYIYRHVNTATSFATSGVLTTTVPNPDILPYGGSIADLTSVQKSEIIVIANTNGAGVLTTNMSGTAGAADAGGEFIVNGVGTAFLTEFKVGQYINLSASGFRQIIAIESNIKLKVDTSWTAAAGKTIARMIPNHSVIPLVDTGTVISTSADAKTINIDLGKTLSATLSATIYVNVKKVAISSGQIPKTSSKSYIKIDTATHTAGAEGPWCLGLPDVWVINAVYEGATYSTSNTNSIGKFQFTTGQKDSHYGLAYLHLKTSSTLTGTQLLIEVEMFQPATAGGYFTVESYPVDDSITPAANTIKTEFIPIHISDTGQEFDLRDCLDTRPFANRTANIEPDPAGVVSENPSSTEVLTGILKLPAPNQLFSMDLNYYLGRVDSVIVDSYGNFSVLAGIESDGPIPSKTPDGSMLIGYATVPPFPTLTTKLGSELQRPEYTVLTKQVQQKRFTMDDLGSMDRRLTSMEYYTSLSLLEKAAEDMFIPDGNGLNRFKHGIFVDNFETVMAGDFSHPEFSVGYKTTESAISAPFEVFNLNFKYESGTNVDKKGELIIGSSADVVAISQTHASRVRNAAESFWSWKGTGSVLPAYDGGFDTNTNPVSTSTSPAINSIIGINNAARTGGRINFTIPLLGNNSVSRTGGTFGSWTLARSARLRLF